MSEQGQVGAAGARLACAGQHSGTGSVCEGPRGHGGPCRATCAAGPPVYWWGPLSGPRDVLVRFNDAGRITGILPQSPLAREMAVSDLTTLELNLERLARRLKLPTPNGDGSTLSLPERLGRLNHLTMTCLGAVPSASATPTTPVATVLEQNRDALAAGMQKNLDQPEPIVREGAYRCSARDEISRLADDWKAAEQAMMRADERRAPTVSTMLTGEDGAFPGAPVRRDQQPCIGDRQQTGAGQRDVTLPPPALSDPIPPAEGNLREVGRATLPDGSFFRHVEVGATIPATPRGPDPITRLSNQYATLLRRVTDLEIRLHLGAPIPDGEDDER